MQHILQQPQPQQLQIHEQLNINEMLKNIDQQINRHMQLEICKSINSYVIDALGDPLCMQEMQKYSSQTTTLNLLEMFNSTVENYEKSINNNKEKHYKQITIANSQIQMRNMQIVTLMEQIAELRNQLNDRNHKNKGLQNKIRGYQAQIEMKEYTIEHCQAQLTEIKRYVHEEIINASKLQVLMQERVIKYFGYISSETEIVIPIATIDSEIDDKHLHNLQLERFPLLAMRNEYQCRIEQTLQFIASLNDKQFTSQPHQYNLPLSLPITNHNLQQEQQQTITINPQTIQIMNTYQFKQVVDILTQNITKLLQTLKAQKNINKLLSIKYDEYREQTQQQIENLNNTISTHKALIINLQQQNKRLQDISSQCNQINRQYTELQKSYQQVCNQISLSAYNLSQCQQELMNRNRIVEDCRIEIMSLKESLTIIKSVIAANNQEKGIIIGGLEQSMMGQFGFDVRNQDTQPHCNQDTQPHCNQPPSHKNNSKLSYSINSCIVQQMVDRSYELRLQNTQLKKCITTSKQTISQLTKQLSQSNHKYCNTKQQYQSQIQSLSLNNAQQQNKIADLINTTHHNNHIYSVTITENGKYLQALARLNIENQLLNQVFHKICRNQQENQHQCNHSNNPTILTNNKQQSQQQQHEHEQNNIIESNVNCHYNKKDKIHMLDFNKTLRMGGIRRNSLNVTASIRNHTHDNNLQDQENQDRINCRMRSNCVNQNSQNIQMRVKNNVECSLAKTQQKQSTHVDSIKNLNQVINYMINYLKGYTRNSLRNRCWAASQGQHYLNKANTLHNLRQKQMNWQKIRQLTQNDNQCKRVICDFQRIADYYFQEINRDGHYGSKPAQSQESSEYLSIHNGCSVAQNRRKPMSYFRMGGLQTSGYQTHKQKEK